jgi:hypothetical protein
MFLFSKHREVVWGKPAATAAERKLIFKIDTVILSFCCLMYRVNYLDRMNLNNANVSGMREDLGFHSKQLNIINTSNLFCDELHLQFSRVLLMSSQLSFTAASYSDRSPTTSRCKSFLRTSTSLAALLDGVS